MLLISYSMHDYYSKRYMSVGRKAKLSFRFTTRSRNFIRIKILKSVVTKCCIPSYSIVLLEIVPIVHRNKQIVKTMLHDLLEKDRMSVWHN